MNSPNSSQRTSLQFGLGGKQSFLPLPVPGGLHMPPTRGVSLQLPKAPHEALCPGWFPPWMNCAKGLKEVLVCLFGGMSTRSSTALETSAVLGIHRDHAVKVLRHVTVLHRAPPAGLSQGTAIQAPGQAGPSLFPAPHAEDCKVLPGGKAGRKTGNLADFCPF